jgi:hypothetical protein
MMRNKKTALLERKQIASKWVPKIKSKLAGMSTKRQLNEKDLTTIARMAHIRALYESTATLDGTPGRGGVALGNNPNTGLANFYGDPGDRGSGEVYSNLFGVFIEVMANTIGFELVPVVPMDKSSGTIYIVEPVYGDGRMESTTKKPLVVKVKGVATGTAPTLVVGTKYTIKTAASGGEDIVDVYYVGKHRLDGSYVFKLDAQKDNSGSAGTDWSSQLVKEFFDTSGNGSAIYTDASNYLGFDPDSVDYVEGFTNFIGGMSGAGLNDTNAWFMGRGNGTRYNAPMSRKVGERSYYRSMGLRTWSRNISAETVHIDIEYTTEQIQDLEMDHGINALELGDTVLQDQLSQHINDHILGRIFALGWQHHYNLYTQNSANNLNLYFDTSGNTGSANAFLGADGATALTIPGVAGALPNSSAISENMSTLQRRLVTRITQASSLINNRSRRGRGDCAVLNTNLASALRDVRGFTAAPFNNDLNDAGLYFVGTLNGVKVYEDPLMDVNDGRVAVFRKGNETDPGIKMCPYLLAEKISTIAEGTMAPKEALKSRYTLAEGGRNPELNYLTFVVEEAAGFNLQ